LSRRSDQHRDSYQKNEGPAHNRSVAPQCRIHIRCNHRSASAASRIPLSIVATRVSVLEPTVNVQLTRTCWTALVLVTVAVRLAKARSDPPAGSVRLVTLVGELAVVGTEAVLLVVPNCAGLHETLPRTHAQTAQRLPAGGLPQARTYAVLAWDRGNPP
jgi:hypothetical protein